MAGPVPFGWTGKQVAIALDVTNPSRFGAKLIDHNETGCAVEIENDEENATGPRRLFYPWSAIRLIELLEEPDEPAMMIG